MGEDDKFRCCHSCIYRGSSDCDDCEEADLYELDEDALVEEEDRRMAA